LLSEAWALAIETLSWIELHRLSERLALKKAAGQLGIKDPKALGLAHRLVLETLRRQNLLDFVLNHALSPYALGDFKLGSQAFLRLYTYETLFEKGGFEKARKMARVGRSILGWRTLKGVEEALGRILSMEWNKLLKELGDEERTALLTFNPTWFVKYCFRLFGRKEALEFLENSVQPSPIYLRVNTLKASEKDVLKKLEDEKIQVERVPKLMHTYRLVKARKPLVRTRGFREGYFYIQDMASSLAAEVANPKAGITVLDACAAPGAKTSYMAQLMGNKGRIFAVDYSKRRMHIWKRQMKRMGVKIAVPVIADVCRSLPTRVDADLVVLDPPCTSTGAFGKMPSAKWRLTKRSVSHMAQIQWMMLRSCAERVKEGGFLVYSTCSVTVEENEVLIERFLKWHPEFTLVETEPRVGLPGLRGQTKCQRLYPHVHNCNGFFIAKLLKTT